MIAVTRIAVAAMAFLPLEAAAQGLQPPASMETPGPAPDYQRAEAWAAWPGAPGAAATTPAGASAAVRRPAVDVFYIHPTTDRSTARLNQPTGDADVDRWTDTSVIARQASIFNGCCRVFAPRYRQATRGSSIASPALREQAMALAYQDVLRAFDLYLAREPRRPFILVGHSQGAAHLERLLRERIDSTVLQRRLVAAYVVGVTLPEGAFGTEYKTLRVCSTPAQVGCVAHWNTMLESGDAAPVLKQVTAINAKRLDGRGSTRMVCVNPLTFDTSRPAATASAARGAVPGKPDESAIAPLVRGAVAARCEDGILKVRLSREIGLEPLPGGSMHYHDLGLFYEDVRANAKLRVSAYFKQGAAARRR